VVVLADQGCGNSRVVAAATSGALHHHWRISRATAQSVKYLPEPTPAFYATLGKNARARQALAADFQRIYGPKTETINRDTASHTSVTEAQASQVLATTMPAVVKAVGKANTNVNEMGFGRQLRNLQA
jgi:hypothetical protein